MTPRLPWLCAALLGLALAAPATPADRFPTRAGESGLLDVPDAETAPRGAGRLGAEVGLAQPRGASSEVAPLPVSLVTGFGRSLEVGVAMRQGGMPGDPDRSPTLFTGAMKLRLVEDTGWFPALAVDAYLDRFNVGGVAGSRLIASTPQIGAIRLAGYLGAEGHGPKPVSVGPTGGLAAEIAVRKDLDAVLEAATGPRGSLVGAAVRLGVLSNVGVSIGTTWLPGEGGLRFSLGFAVSSAPPKARRRLLVPEAPKPAVAVVKKPEEPVFADPRPRFRLNVASVGSPADGARRHLPYAMAPEALKALGKGGLRKGPSPEQARASELLALAEALDQREKRLRSAEGALAQRTERLAAEGQRLQAREGLLDGHGAALDARELQIQAAGKALERELQLAAVEDQLRGTERELKREEQQAAEAAAAAATRERAAQAKEEVARSAAEQALAAAPSPDVATPAALDGRAKVLATRDTHFAALEARLGGARERLEGVDRQLHARADRLDTVERRLSAKEERLKSIELRARPRSAAPPPAAGPAAAAALAAVLGPLEVQRASPGAQPAAPPPGVEVLPAGESGKRRLRDVVLQHRADLERCADPGVAPEPGARGEAVLRLTVDGSGRVTDLQISTAGAEGAPLEACLRSAVQGWRLPAGEPGYTADIPMTLVRSGARP